MRLLAFVVKDEKANAFGHPFFTSANGLAMRMFQDWCGDKSMLVGKHPEDFSLFRVGSFDDDVARFDNEVTPVLMASGSDFTPVVQGLRDGIREVR